MRLLPVALLLAAPLVAAPVPKELKQDSVRKLFGKAVEPKGMAVTFDPKEWSATLTATPPADAAKSVVEEHHVLRSPRTAREVSGDFDLSVSVTLPDQADITVTAGLYASYGDDSFVILGRTLESKGQQKNRREDLIKSFVGGKLWNSQGGTWKVSVEAFGVRLIRRGDTITPYQLIDGKWEDITRADTKYDWPEKGTVGVYVRSSNGEGTATFKEFKLTQTEK